MTEFQPIVPAFFDGKINSVTVESALLLMPTTIVNQNDPWNIRVDFETEGFFAPLLGGTWQVRAFLESLGPGFEGIAGTTVIAAGLPLRRAAVNIPILAGNPLGLVPGIYKLVVTVTHLNPGPTGIAGYYEAGVVEIVQP